MKRGWTEVRALVPLGWQELVAEALILGPCTSVAFGRPSLASPPAPPDMEYVRTFMSEDEDEEGVRAALRRSVEDLAKRAQVPELESIVLEFRRLPPEDYARSWRKTWRPFRVGRLCITPEEVWSAKPGDLRMWLEPCGAFGSGRHATTRTCLKVIQDRVRGGERILDAGSGSGILSVAAVLLGAEHATGFDTDPHARAYAEELAEKNAVSQRCDFRTGRLLELDLPAKPLDAVFANIYSDVIQAEVGELVKRLAHGGWFVFSGCPDQHRDATLEAIERSGLEVQRVRLRGRWHTFEGIRP